MTTPDPATGRSRSGRWRRRALFPWLAAVALMLLPPQIATSLRSDFARVLHPGQIVAARVREFTSNAIHRAQCAMLNTNRLIQLEQQNQTLAARTRQLEFALKSTRAEADELRALAAASPQSTAELMTTRPVAVRVLGGRARGLLESRAMIGAGAVGGVSPGALVLAQPLLDLGNDAGLQAGDCVLIGREVWGQIVTVDRWSSTARHVTEPGHRALVQLADDRGERLRLGPAGVLEGTGEPLCRVRMVAVTEPVSVGDMVLTRADDIPFERLSYGRVVRVEQPRGADHWEIWMQPAAASQQLPPTVAVLRTELNPARVAGVPQSQR